MNVGEQTIDWLYREQLQVDDEWSVRTPGGFRWWPHQQAQTIEVVSEQSGPDGQTGYWISIRTELLRDVDLDDRLAMVLNGLLMPFASMACPVHDATARTVDLYSLMRVHTDVAESVRALLSIAAGLQIGEVRIMGPQIANLFKLTVAQSGHPTNGARANADELAELIAIMIAPLGKERGRWSAAEFKQVVQQYMRQPPALAANAGGQGCTVEFPYGDTSSLCRMMGDQPHPRYGNGLLLLQSFPIEPVSEAEGARLALSLNAPELMRASVGRGAGYGLGSYVYRDNMLHFTAFMPNAAYQGGVLPNAYLTAASRARDLSVRFTKRDWDAAAASGPRRSALGRLWDRVTRA